MTVLVTGATGFLGRHLVDQLLERGAAVRALVRSSRDADDLRNRGVDVVLGQITDSDRVRVAAAGCGRVYHLAGVVSHRRRDLALLQAVNVVGTRCLLSVVDPGTRVVHVSSVAAIGPVASPELRADERHAFPAEAADLPYAASKRDGERAVREALTRGVDVVIANPGFLLGPGDRHRVSTWPVAAYLAGRLRFTIAGGLCFVDARDVARGLITLADQGRSGERTILAGEHGNLSWRDFFALVSDVAGARRLITPLPRRIAQAAAHLTPWLASPDEVRAAAHWWFASAAKAEHELGFSTRPIMETLADTIRDHAHAVSDPSKQIRTTA